MTDLVTGATGFIGAYVVRALAERGRSVIGLDANPDERYASAVIPEPLSQQVDLVPGDVTDLFGLEALISDNSVDRIIHLAGLKDVRTTGNPREAVRVTGMGTLNVFEAAKAAGVTKVVWASTAAVYGYQPGVIDAVTRPAPSSIYGSLKLMLEHSSHVYRERDGVEITGVRYNVVYGYGRHIKTSRKEAPKQQLLQLIDNPAMGQPGTVLASDTRRNWVHMDDVVRATIAAVNTPSTPLPAYNVVGHSATYREIAAIMRRILPDSKLTLEPGNLSGSLGTEYDDKTVDRDLGYRPAISLEEGLRRTVQTFREREPFGYDIPDDQLKMQQHPTDNVP